MHYPGPLPARPPMAASHDAVHRQGCRKIHNTRWHPILMFALLLCAATHQLAYEGFVVKIVLYTLIYIELVAGKI